MNVDKQKLGAKTSSSPPPALDYHLLFESGTGLYLVLTLDFKIAAVSDSYLRATMTKAV